MIYLSANLLYCIFVLWIPSLLMFFILMWRGIVLMMGKAHDFDDGEGWWSINRSGFRR